MLIVCQLLTYYHVVVDSEKDEKKQKGRKFYYKIPFSDFFDILGRFRDIKIFQV